MRKRRPQARELTRLAMELHRVGHLPESHALLTLEQKLWEPGSYETALLQARQLIKRGVACYRAEEAANA